MSLAELQDALKQRHRRGYLEKGYDQNQKRLNAWTPLDALLHALPSYHRR